MRRRVSTTERDIQANHGISRTTVFIGDLHGSRDALQVTLHSLGLLTTEGKWRGRETDLILAGDVLADRVPDDFKVAHLILKLRRQIEEAGGQLTVLMGNHDLEALQFILGGISSPLVRLHATQSSTGLECLAGIRTLASAGMKSQKGQRPTLDELFQRRCSEPNFRERFHAKRKGRDVEALLEHMQVWHKAGATLFQHTPPTASTLSLFNDPLLSGKGIATALLGDTQPPVDPKAWFLAMQRWVFAKNRHRNIPPDHDQSWDSVTNEGIRVVAHGHDNSYVWDTVRQTPNGPLTILGADRSFGKIPDDFSQPDAIFSAAVFNPDDTIRVGFSREY